METIKEANNATIKAIPSGANNFPSIPDKKNKGKNATMIIKVALITELLISKDPSKITVILSFCSAFGLSAFSLSRLKTFSTSIMASSTKSPMAMAIPPKLIVLIVKPSHFKVIIATINEIGIASIEIKVALQFIRNKNRIMMTKAVPSNKVF